ncbi:MAG: site-specific integrase [Desulfobacteraceae bacterium]|nr:site-specific integrase [Desulfobacteraceae bacterium]
MSYFTGLRPGATELFRLTYSDLDLEQDTIFIVSAKKKGPPFRVVPLHNNLRRKLKKWMTEDIENKIQCREIIHFKGLAIKSIKTSFAGAKRRAGITRKLRMYDFRHAAITMMLSSGADLKSVSQIAGHSRTDTTTKIYQHTNTDLLRTQIDLIPDLEDEL